MIIFINYLNKRCGDSVYGFSKKKYLPLVLAHSCVGKSPPHAVMVTSRHQLPPSPIIEAL